MAKSRPSVQKRNKEARKFEKAQAKAARKAARAAERNARIEAGVRGDEYVPDRGPDPRWEDGVRPRDTES